MLKIKELGSSSSGNAYIIYNGHAPLLLECGLSFTTIKQDLWNNGYSLSQLSGCLVTHEHLDHSKAAGKLAGAGVDIYTSAGTAETITTDSQHRIHRVKAGQTFKVGSWSCYAFDTVHDAEEPLGFVLSNGTERLLFATDTAYIKYRFSGLTHIMVEANYSRDLLHASDIHPTVKHRVVQNHFCIEHVLEMLKANDLSQLQEIWLLHLSDNHACASDFRRMVQEATGVPVKIAAKRSGRGLNCLPDIQIKKTDGQVIRRWA